MRFAIAALGVSLAAVFTVPRTIPAESRLKDRGAMMIYEGRDRVLALLPFADSANLTLIMLNVAGDVVAKPDLAGRPCIGVALFSKKEWAALTAQRGTPSAVRPSEASIRFRVFPATKNARVAMEDVREGTAHVAIGLEMLHEGYARDTVFRAPLKWSVQEYLDKARGPCTAE